VGQKMFPILILKGIEQTKTFDWISGPTGYILVPAAHGIRKEIHWPATPAPSLTSPPAHLGHEATGEVPAIRTGSRPGKRCGASAACRCGQTIFSPPIRTFLSLSFPLLALFLCARGRRWFWCNTVVCVPTSCVMNMIMSN
jgi:hypothetical protein